MKKLHPRKPSGFIYALAVILCRLFFFPLCHVKIIKKNMDGIKAPYVMLSNHTSSLDFFYACIALYPQKLNMVVSSFFFVNKHVRRLLQKMGCISKEMFEPDVQSVKNMIKVIKRGGCIGLYPEGRQCVYGALETLSPVTVHLLKHLQVPVIHVHLSGAHLTFPKWGKGLRRGEVQVMIEPMFSTEELKQYTDIELYERMLAKLDYDEFAWQEQRHVAFKSRCIAKGLENILYHCPKCGRDITTKTDAHRIFCTHCGNSAVLNKYYELIPEQGNCVIPRTIRDWFLLQKECEHNTIVQAGVDFKFEDKVILNRPSHEGRGLKKAGEGILTLTGKGFAYKGTMHGQKTELFFPLHTTPALPFGAGKSFDVYSSGQLYCFEAVPAQKTVQWSVIGEQAYLYFIKGQ